MVPFIRILHLRTLAHHKVIGGVIVLTSTGQRAPSRYPTVVKEAWRREEGRRWPTIVLTSSALSGGYRTAEGAKLESGERTRPIQPEKSEGLA